MLKGDERMYVNRKTTKYNVVKSCPCSFALKKEGKQVHTPDIAKKIADASQYFLCKNKEAYSKLADR